ncbi:hypothetical protein [Streptomyces sp. NPDC048663]|uniref:hypothetical protein n=1 Tax=Streptomyces sp. NPDC048663 TaxID=3155638 RepID=UPI003423B41B
MSAAAAPPPTSRSAAACACTHETAPCRRSPPPPGFFPYGDLHHYAHSAHPGLRWNYLPAFESHLALPHYTPDGLLLGRGTVARRQRQALAGTTAAPHPEMV